MAASNDTDASVIVTIRPRTACASVASMYMCVCVRTFAQLLIALQFGSLAHFLSAVCKLCCLPQSADTHALATIENNS